MPSYIFYLMASEGGTSLRGRTCITIEESSLPWYGRVESIRVDSGRRWLRDSEMPRAVLLLVVLLTQVHLQCCYRVSINATTGILSMVLVASVQAKHESSVTWWVVYSILC